MHTRARTSKASRSATLSGLLLMPLLLTMVAAPSSATSPGLILAIDLGTPEGPAALQAVGYQPCISWPNNVCYDLVSPAQFATDPFLFAGHQILFVGWTENAAAPAIAALNARANDIEAFVQNGGAIVALSEYSLGQFQWVPQGSQITLFQEHLNDVALTAAGASHPIMAGQTSATLSGWGNSRHNYMTSYPAYLHVLATASNPLKAVDLAGHYGAGCVALLGQDPDWHIVYGGVAAAHTLLSNTLKWALTCECHDVPCEPKLTVSGTPHPRHTVVDPFDFSDRVGRVSVRPDYGVTWLPVLGYSPVVLESPVDEVSFEAEVEPVLPLEPVRDLAPPVVRDDGEVPRFYGATTVNLEPCDCFVEGWRLTYTVVDDVAPFNDPIGPVATMTGPTSWTISAADYDTYRITFTVILICEDGTVRNVSATWDQFN